LTPPPTPGPREQDPWLQALADITERLRDGRYPHGQPLPRWPELLDELRYGGPNVHRALQHLETRQLVTPTPTGWTAGPLQPPP